MNSTNASSTLGSSATASQSQAVERRRSTRLNVAVPVTLTGKDAGGGKFQEECRTVSINRHGATIRTSHVITPGTDLLIKNPSLGITARAQAVSFNESKTPSELARVSLKLVDLKNVWGIQYPPRDWELSRTVSETVETADHAPSPIKVIEVDLSGALAPMLVRPENDSSSVALACAPGTASRTPIAEKAKTSESGARTTEPSEAAATRLRQELERTLERLEEKQSALLALEERLTALVQTMSVSCSTLEGLVSEAKEIERLGQMKTSKQPSCQ